MYTGERMFEAAGLGVVALVLPVLILLGFFVCFVFQMNYISLGDGLHFFSLFSFFFFVIFYIVGHCLRLNLPV